MRFGTKMMAAFTVMLALAFGIGGSALITTSTNNSVKQSQDAAVGQHALLLYTLSTVGGAAERGSSGAFDAEYGGYGGLVDAITRLDAQGEHSWRSLRVTDESGIIYVSRDFSLYRDGLTDSAESDSFAMLTFRSGEGVYLLQIAGELQTDSGLVYLESLYDISPVFAGRQYQQTVYRWLYIAVMLVGAALSWLLSFYMTMPLRRLSYVTRTIASGNLSIRARGGGDEIGVLAEDFNHMAEHLERNINELKDTMRRQEEFMGGLAHELKTPMTSIIGYADLLRGHELSETDKRDAANYIFREGRRLEILMLKLLDLIVLQKRDFKFIPMQIKSIVKDAASLLQPALTKRGIRLTYSCDGGVCLIEPDLFMSLLINLIDNARKAITDAGEIKITSKTSEGCCVLRITDDGGGIPEGELSKIKDAFYRVDKSRARSQGGVGLGLRLCDEIASVHDGEISFESEVGKGTTVIITLKEAPRVYEGTRGIGSAQEDR